MIVKHSDAKTYLCPIARANCIGLDCMMWKWITDKHEYYDKIPYDYAPTCPKIEDDLTISFEKGASGRTVNMGEAKGTCGLIK